MRSSRWRISDEEPKRSHRKATDSDKPDQENQGTLNREVLIAHPLIRTPPNTAVKSTILGMADSLFDGLRRQGAVYLKRALDAVTPLGDEAKPPKKPPTDTTAQVPAWRTSLGPIGWSVDNVRAALASHASGVFSATGLLADDFFLHPVIAKCLNERVDGLFNELPRKLTPGRENKQGRWVRDWFAEIQSEVYSDAIFKDMCRDELQMGQMILGWDWEERKDGAHRWWLPVLKPWHPSLTQYVYRSIDRSVDGGCFLATSMNKGMLHVEPGLGRWMLAKRGERSPWLHGAVYSLSQDFIGDMQNFLDNLAFEERFGLGLMTYSHDETYQRGQVNQSTAAIANVGAGAVVPLRMRAGTPLEKLDLVHTSGAGWEAFEATEMRILRRILMYYLGQDMTSMGQTGGYRQAVVHKGVRWNKHEETAGWFFDGRKTTDEEQPEKVIWEPHRNTLYNQLSRWIGWFNFRDWDIMPLYWFDATPPDQMAEREEREAKQAKERAGALQALATALPVLQKAFPEKDPYEWFEDCKLLPELTDEERERRAKMIKKRPKLEDQPEVSDPPAR